MAAAAATAIHRFPIHVRIWAHPGITCSIKSSEDLERVHEKANKMFAEVLASPEGMARVLTPEEQIQMTQAVSMPDCLKRIIANKEISKTLHATERGLTVPFYDDTRAYNEALNYVENNCLSTPLHLLTLPQFQEMLKNIHARLISPANPILGPMRGKYRSADMSICKLPLLNCRETGLPYLTKTDPASIPYYLEIRKHMDRGVSCLEIKRQNLISPQAMLFLEKHYIITPSPGEIEPLIIRMFEELQKKLAAEDPISTAAWLHQEFVRIHPMADANGREARIWMNMVLMQGGHSAIGFAHDSDYTRAIQAEDRGEVGAFERFIRGVVAQFDYEAIPDDLLIPMRKWQNLFEARPEIARLFDRVASTPTLSSGGAAAGTPLGVRV